MGGQGRAVEQPRDEQQAADQRTLDETTGAGNGKNKKQNELPKHSSSRAAVLFVCYHFGDSAFAVRHVWTRPSLNRKSSSNVSVPLSRRRPSRTFRRETSTSRPANDITVTIISLGFIKPTLCVCVCAHTLFLLGCTKYFVKRIHVYNSL